MPIERPSNVGENTAVDPNKLNFSFTNINKEFKNWRFVFKQYFLVFTQIH